MSSSAFGSLGNDDEHWISTSDHAVAYRLRKLINIFAAGAGEAAEGSTARDDVAELLESSLSSARRLGFGKIETASKSEWLPTWLETLSALECRDLLASCEPALKMAAEDLFDQTFLLGEHFYWGERGGLTKFAEVLHYAYEFAADDKTSLADGRRLLTTVRRRIVEQDSKSGSAERAASRKERAREWRLNYSTAVIQSHLDELTQLGASL